MRSCEISRADLAREGGWTTSKRDHVRSREIIPAAPHVKGAREVDAGGHTIQKRGEIHYPTTHMSYYDE